MLAQKENKPAAKENELEIVRILDAPRELVYRLWTTAEHLEKWNAPQGCSIHYSKIDVRPGGEFLSVVKNPAYPDCWVKGVYLELQSPERIAYTMEMSDEQGNINLPQYQNADWPASTIVTLRFEELPENRTRLTLRQSVSEAAAMRKGAYQGWLSSFDVMDQYLAGITGKK
ncbi:SRPBCC family protein [Pseudoflavitalea rhizosphaerae]|uniref:SRPBCC family protein n=1 Tax=Pseudoflavitalea rhizosphaerae TaxID=1884793 RepID=UPI0013DFD696|nr:SRPBCC domain-containing protein [Pseudoflavitalea rhizosphaerae]